MIVDDYDKYNPLAPSKVKGFLFAYFLGLLISLISSTTLVAKPTKAVINTITAVQKTIVGFILSYNMRLNT